MDLLWLSKWRPQLLAALRIVVGLLFVEHGTVKLFGFPTQLMPGELPPLLITAGIIEFIAGLFIALGLFTRTAALIASGEMAVAYFIAHFPQSFWPALNDGEGAILYCFVFLYLAGAGPGAPRSVVLRSRPEREII
jgi:putative oxidoreductase